MQQQARVNLGINYHCEFGQQVREGNLRYSSSVHLPETPRTLSECQCNMLLCLQAAWKAQQTRLSSETSGTNAIQVVLVGSSERLGNWRADSGLAMQWNEGDDWTIDLDLPVE